MRALLALWSCTALAGVGTVTELEGEASRTPKGATAPVELEVGSEVELGDTLEVAAGGNLALTLTDRSVIALAAGSRLALDEARFQEQGSRVFSARLLLGSLWARVTRLAAGSESKFEIATERGVAGVRGTIFTVDLGPGDGAELEVGVEEGEVEVAHAAEEAPPAVAAAAAPAPAGVAGRLDLRAAERQVPAAPAPPRFTRLERISAGGAVTFGPRALARHRFQLRHPRMAAFIGKHRGRWLKLAIERERERGAHRRELRELREQRRRRR